MNKPRFLRIIRVLTDRLNRSSKGRSISLSVVLGNRNVSCQRVSSLPKVQGLSSFLKDFSGGRPLSTKTNLTEDNIKKAVEEISDKFSEAIGLLEDARQSLGTVYISEDMKDAEEMVEEILNDYQTLLAKLNEKQRYNVTRTIGLKMSELKAQLDIVRDLCKE